MNITRARASAAASLIAVATMVSLAAAPAASAASTARLAVNAPMAIQTPEGNNVIWFGSLQVKSGDTTTCLTLSNFTDVHQVGARLELTTDAAVSLGTSYDISAWESALCDVYVPEWGRRTRSLGAVTATPTVDGVSNGVWHVTIP